MLKRCGACRSGLGSLHGWQAAQFMIVQLLFLYLLLHYRRRTGMLRQLFHGEIRIERFEFNLVSPQKNIPSQDLVKVVLFTCVTNSENTNEFSRSCLSSDINDYSKCFLTELKGAWHWHTSFCEIWQNCQFYSFSA